MFAFLSEFLKKNHIVLFAPIALSDCRITRPYLLEREGITDGSVLMLAVPYLTEAACSPSRNLSAYAVGEDYHLFFQQLFEALLPELRTRFPSHRFAGFADHSPIAEIEAAARAGLGVIGKNHLLLTEQYSSYIFLGEIITDAKLPSKCVEIVGCKNCDACQKSCPINECGTCLSALTQKKGALSEAEAAILASHGLAWGCDRCQEVCPYTQRALQNGSIFSPIPYFQSNPIAHLTLDALEALSEEAFQKRAYSWRGRETIGRNLLLLKDKENKTKGDPPC